MTKQREAMEKIWKNYPLAFSMHLAGWSYLGGGVILTPTRGARFLMPINLFLRRQIARIKKQQAIK